MHFDRMRRREFITLLGGAAAWPLAARAQQSEHVRRIGVLTPLAADDAQGQARLTAFFQELRELGWIDGRNVRIDTHWNASKPDEIRKYAAEFVALPPDVILAAGSPIVAGLQSEIRTVPIVFVQVTDPVAAGFVDSLARPGGNITGFMNFEYGISGKWLELLKEIAPRVTRVAVVRDLTTGLGQLGALQSTAPSFDVELFPIGTRDAGEIERGISAFAQAPNGGMIVPAGAAVTIYREPIIMLATRYRLPAVYSDRVFVTGGGLIAYGPDRVDPFRRAAGYVDRILKGAKPADLPVQAPTKYELVINLKTAKTLGLAVPPSLLGRADEVIE
jgi:putative tryptophan/tyrosine transport system substrate-binding protein